MMPILRVFPAPAGINRYWMPDDADPAGVPRASGDKPMSVILFSIVVGCSPRQRG
ncbi:TPA: hypothetical protein K8163_004244 [Escherichia coli]|nr:hypothetical protein [Escherichia coli]